MNYYIIRKVNFSKQSILRKELITDKRYFKGIFVRGLNIYYVNPVDFRFFKKKYYNLNKEAIKVVHCNNFCNIIKYI